MMARVRYLLWRFHVFVMKFSISFKLPLAILWHVIEAAVRGGCRHHYCSSYTGASECTGTREICPQHGLADTSTLFQSEGGRLCPPIRSPACLESFRCACYTTPSVGWDIQEVRFHCNFSFRQVYKSSCIITIWETNEIQLLFDRKIWNKDQVLKSWSNFTW